MNVHEEIGVKTRNAVQASRTVAGILLILSSMAFAGQWKPLCAEGGLCKLGRFNQSIDPNSESPPVTSEGFFLHYRPTNYSSGSNSELLLVSSQDIEKFGPIENRADSYTSDINMVELPSGTKLNFSLYTVAIWQDSEDEILYGSWNGWSVLNLNLADFVGPPVIIDSTVFVGVSRDLQYIFVSDNEGLSWKSNYSDFQIGGDRYNLVPNPEGTALWAIQSAFFGSKESLRESNDQGVTWTAVDDGSFPTNTVRIVHDPESPTVSYALTDHGLFISENRGVTWQETSLTEAIHSLIFVDGNEVSVRVLVVGTDSGIKLSTDEMESWTDMSKGLLAQPHSVTYGHDLLIATSDSGYFSCNTLDCFGAAQSLASEPERGIVKVIEFYHPDLDQYFISATEEEVNAVDQGAAGIGWVRTGEKFHAWGLGGGDSAASDVCRFYGSFYPGPNSHFYSVSQPECRFQMDLQELIPDGKPRWNFEGYAFSIMPPAQDVQQPCPETAIPVYRAYNDGHKQGKDSNHRYMTNLDLMSIMVSKGWIDEGVVFCSPKN